MIEKILLQDNKEFERFFEINLNLLSIADVYGNFIKVNKAWSKLLGYTTDEIESMKFLDFIHPQDLEKTLNAVDKLKEQKTVSNFINRFKDKDGNYHYIEWNSSPYGEKIYASAKNITERKIEQKKIQKIKERFELAVEGGNIGIWDWNIQTGKIYYNKNWAEMLGYREGEIDYNVKSWEELIHPEDLKSVNKKLVDFLAGNKKIYRTEHRLKTKAGRWKWIRDIGKISKEDGNGNALRAVGVHIDIDSEKRAKEKIEYLSYHDSLTGLYNYRYLTEEIDRISDSRQYPISIVVGDLDKLKFINDNYGHEVGNDYIKTAADILESTFRKEDVVSRIGGDEFAVVLPNTGCKEAENIIERVKRQFRKIRNIDEKMKHLSISLGISTIEDSSMDFKDAYKSADKKMYQDKALGIKCSEK
ncbi:MAG: sensor domain-containing diguanylate cyclase [Halanaerobium sp.]